MVQSDLPLNFNELKSWLSEAYEAKSTWEWVLMGHEMLLVVKPSHIK